MGAGKKNTIFPYSFKSVCAGPRAASSIGATSGWPALISGQTPNLIGFEIINPQDFYACVNLISHIMFTHNSVARNIIGVYVTDTQISPTWFRSIAVNSPAVGLVNNFRIDVTAMRNTTGKNIVWFNFDGAVAGTLNMFKSDMQYQVIGIR